MKSCPEVLVWAKAQLPSGHSFSEEILCDTPYSRVTSLSDGSQRFYLKEVAGDLRREPAVIALLAKLVPGLPQLIATHDAFAAFLMADAGRAQRQIYRETKSADSLLKGVQVYAAIQLAAIERTQSLFALGVPDWQVSKLPLLFSELLVAPELADFLRSHDLVPALQLLERRCTALLATDIPATIEHADFHDANIVVSGSDVRVIDWGEAIISHPFFSLARMLASLRSQHQLELRDPVAIAVQDAYFKPWQEQFGAQACQQALALVMALGPFYAAIAYAQLARASGEAGQRYWQKNIPELLTQCLKQV